MLTSARDKYVDISFLNTNKATYDGIYQYDTGMKLRAAGVDTSLQLNKIMLHYSYDGLKEVISVIPDSFTNGILTGNIPDAVLAQDKIVRCFIYITDENFGITAYEAELRITPRPLPE